MLWTLRQCENMDKASFEGVGKYEVPRILPMEIEEPVEMIGFNFAAKHRHPEQVGVHFFLKDYQFSRLWTSPDIYTDMLRKFRFVCTPDFSMFTDFPLALQINSHYRKHWLGAYWQSKGITVIPTICWSDERSFDWCFDGEPENSTVAVSSVGTQMERRAKSLFLLGYEQMISRLQPKMVLFHGRIPGEITTKMAAMYGESGPKLVPVAAYQEHLRKIETGVT